MYCILLKQWKNKNESEIMALKKVIKSVAFIKFYLQAFISSPDLKAFYDTSIMVVVEA
jgi:hypothetical protein